MFFFEDEDLRKLLCITKGACKFTKIETNGEQLITELLGAGDLMGRRSLITQKGALLRATAITDIQLYCLQKEPVLNSIKNNSAFCFDVLHGFIDDTVKVIKKMDLYKNHRTTKKRLAGLLVYLHNKFGTNKKD